VQQLGFAGKQHLDGALETRDVQRLVREVQYEYVAHVKPSLRVSFTHERHARLGQHLRDRQTLVGRQPFFHSVEGGGSDVDRNFSRGQIDGTFVLAGKICVRGQGERDDYLGQQRLDRRYMTFKTSLRAFLGGWALRHLETTCYAALEAFPTSSRR
jgi:hypothetical protein